ncbi:MAG: hypothetical protein ACKO9G_21100, partial [Dolichospermum sp.]
MIVPIIPTSGESVVATQIITTTIGKCCVIGRPPCTEQLHFGCAIRKKSSQIAIKIMGNPKNGYGVKASDIGLTRDI